MLAPEAIGADLLVSAQTGSGKTVAYGIAVADTLLEGEERLGPAAQPLALVVAPTRELALQVHRELEWLYEPAGGRAVSCVGGMEMFRERRALAAGAHIVVGTPGRLRDHLERGSLDASLLRAVVLDEADEMLDLGFREDLEFILQATPAERRTLLFSATVPKPIATLARTFQRNAVRVAVSPDGEPHGDIQYRALRIAPNDRDNAVINVLRHAEAPGALVFCATREGVRHLGARLAEHGFSAVTLSGELGQNERSRALQALRDGRARVCVATDVAARGIDLPGLELVIHADLPGSRETLLHRSGRTGRAGAKGVSVLLVPHTRRRQAERLIAAAGVTAAWASPPTVADIRAQDRERLLHDPSWSTPPADEDMELGRALLEAHGAEVLAAAVARMHRERAPAPEELLDASPPPVVRRNASGAPERDGPQRTPRSLEGGVWFRMTVGRRHNADPRWLLPLICRRGQVSRREVGTIRILDRESRFEIAPHAAERFLAAVRRADTEDGSVRFDPSERADEAPPQRRYAARRS